LTTLLIGHGIDLVYELMRESDPKKKVQKIAELLDEPSVPFELSEAWARSYGTTQNDIMSQYNPSWIDPFGGVTFIGDEDAASANAAWIWAENYIYPNSAREGLEKDFRSWGYVMWDKERLDQMKILEVDGATLEKHGPRTWNGPLICEHEHPHWEYLLDRLLYRN